ncbi:MAG: 4Fe-4S dicluster domain-containing protein [Clostridia bacterium]|nr:4Fe-4S dicluster domain-containing protein [Clostridia bacterium]
MNNEELRQRAYSHGFERAYFLPAPAFPKHEDEPHILWDASEYEGAVSLLLVRAYSPYPRGERIPAYYISSNASYHAAVALARELEAEGVNILRRELPIKQLCVKYGVGELCRSSLIALPGLGTRVVFQSALVRGGEFRAEEYHAEGYSSAPSFSCENCRACISACPAGAISEDGLDVKKCMRYYMDGADYPEWVYSVQSTHMGCEVCQAVCPRNAHIPLASPTEEERAAFELSRLAEGDTKEARLLVGKNFTGRGKLQKEALHFLGREKEDRN